MDVRLDGRTAIVTGAARGMGQAHAIALAQSGASVLLTDRLVEEGAAAASSMRLDGLDAEFLPLDVCKRDEWDQATTYARERWGRFDILVNNAGIASFPGAADLSRDEWDKTIEINQTGVFLGIQQAANHLNEGGAIINICSIWGVVGASAAFAYQASKGAVAMMTRAAALELAPRGIRVNAICPGLVRTPMADLGGEDNTRAVVAMTPLGRPAEPEEIAASVVFLASDFSSYITGALVAVDGGFTAM